MEPFIVRYRNLLVLLALLAVQIVGLATQVHKTDTGRMSLDPRDSGSVRLLRLWAEAVVAPPERLFHFGGSSFTDLWRNYVDLRHVREQNQQLQQTVDRLRFEQAALLEDARQGQRLQGLFNFQQQYLYKTLAAQVIGSSGAAQSRVFYIDKGSSDGLQHDMAVISPAGIVGKVRDVFPHTSQILVINDQSSGAGVILETTRIRGILRGNALGQPQIVSIISDNRIKPGERVLTAGGDQIFPRGLPVGVVDKVVRDPERDGFINVIVKPYAALDRLDEVLVITSMEPRFPPDQQQDMAESEAIKGAEVQQEEAQKKASQIMAERLPGLIDPNLPADQQPLNDSTPPPPVVHTVQPLRPDRFTPGNATGVTSGQTSAPANSTPSRTP